MPPDLHDDIRSAFNSAAEAGGDDSFSSGASPASEVLPPVEADNPDARGKRGTDGRFTKAASVADSPAAANAASVAAANQAAGNAGTATGQPGQQQAQGLGGEAQVKLDPSKPPSAWTPGGKEKWNSIPLPIREEIIRREEATAQGIQKLQQHYAPALDLMDAVAQHGDYFSHIQAEPIGYINDVIQSEQTLRLGNPAQKLEMMLNLADQYGVPLRSAVNQALNGKLKETLEAAHRQHQTPPSLPPEIARELQEMRSWRDGLESQAASSELQAFAADHPLLDHVRDDMANLLESGAVSTYEDAYNICVYRNPTLRQQALAMQNGQAQLTGVRQRQAAAAGLAAPSSVPLETGAGELEGASDDVHDAVRRAWNQNSGRA